MVGKAMLRVTVCDDSDSVVLKLEGRLAGPWVEEVEKAWKLVTHSSKGEHLCVDLCGVTFVNAEGKKLLARMHKAGADLSALGPMTSYIVRKIKGGHNGHQRGTK